MSRRLYEGIAGVGDRSSALSVSKGRGFGRADTGPNREAVALLIPAQEMSCTVPTGLRSSYVESTFPTLKRGANEDCASDAAAGTFHMQRSTAARGMQVLERDFPRGLKPKEHFSTARGTAKAVPFQWDKLREECGVVAIHGHPDAARQAYLGLYALQHRGQESAGIATADGLHLANIKGMGLVSEIFTDDVLAKLPGPMAIGHTRYSTTGDSALLNAQPIRVDSVKGLIAIAHNGNLVNLGNLRARLERDGAYFQTTSDSEIIVQLIAHSRAGTLVDAIADSLSQIDGAFSIVMMTRDRIFAARDPRGFRPLSMGRMRNPDGPDTIVFVSETCALDLLRAEYIRDVLPGELVMVTGDGVTSRQYATGFPQSSCIFEHVYFARPDSRIFGRWVQESRDQMGRQLARESGVAADVVVPVPDSGVTAAMGYAEEAHLPFRMGLIRNHYVGRTFIEPEQRVRDFGVRLKLNPVRNLLEGKRVILIDDSIIRGTTSRKIVRMVRGAGAREVHLRISCPPTVSPCFYGVDTPRKSELIAANNSIEEIRRFIEADSLAYLSLEGLLKCCDGGEHTGYCTACYTSNYPTQWVDVEEILPAAASL